MDREEATPRRWRAIVEARVPGIGVVRSYERRWLRRDVLAGLALTALLIPEGMAYAQLAGLPPATGLYTTVVALVAYALFGPSRILVVGPDSALGPLIAATVLPLAGAGGDPTKAVALAGMLALIIGVLCVGSGMARFGVVAELMSRPVRIGLLNGIALVVVVGQLPKLFGFSSSATGLYDEVVAFVDGLREGRTVWASLLVGVGSLVLMVALRRWWPRGPGILVAVVASAVATAVLDLPAHGLAVVGAVPSGFPAPSVPDVSLHDMGVLAVAAAGMSFLILADTISVSRSLAAQRGDVVDANAELVALGVANAAAGCFSGFPSSASVTRTAVAASSGSRTQLAGVIAALTTLLVLFTDAGLGKHLPEATLAAVVIVAAGLLLDLTSLRWFWRVSRAEFALSMTAFLGVALLGVLEGIAIAIALSLGDFVRRAWRPHDAVLGRVTGRKGYHDTSRHPDAAQIPGLVLYRFDAPVFFANAEYFADRLAGVISDRAETIRWIVVAAEPVTDVDSTGAECLARLLDEFDAQGITLAFAELKGPVKDRLRAYGIYDRIGDDRFFPTIGTAVNAYVEATATHWVDWTDDSPGAARDRDERDEGAEPDGRSR